MNPEPSTSKINLFALPSQTAILFWLLTGSLLGVILIGSLDPHPITIIGFLPPTLILLSLWGFLERPDREIRQKHLQAAGGRFPLLQKTIEDYAHQIGLKRIPQLLIAERQNEIYEMGSFHHWYIVCGVGRAQVLENELATPTSVQAAQGLVLHELYHFKTGDYWQLGYLDELFRATFHLMLWILAFFWGVTLLFLLLEPVVEQLPAQMLENTPSKFQPFFEKYIMPNFLPEEELSNSSDGEKINWFLVMGFVINLSVPFIGVAAILWRFYRPQLWQMREFYADSGVAQSMGTTAPFLGMLHLNRVPIETQHTLQRKSWAIWIFMKNMGKRFNALIFGRDFWPPFVARVNALSSPQTVFYDWKKTVYLLGPLMLILEMVLAAPFSLLYIRNPVYFTTLMTVMATTYFLLPHILLKKNGLFQGFLIIVTITLIRTVWLFLMLAFAWGFYFIWPNIFSIMLWLMLSNISGNVGYDLAPPDPLNFLVQGSIGNLIQALIVVGIQAFAVLVLVLLSRRICAWYPFLRTSQRFKGTILGVSLGILFIIFTVLFPITNAIFFADTTSFLEPVNIPLLVLGVLTAVSGSIWFFFQDRRHHRKCPNCLTKISESNALGITCPSCKEIYYPWLFTNYEDAQDL